MQFRNDFDLDPDIVWMNASHQAALPRVAAAQAREAIGWKLHPWEMTTQRFTEVPRRLRRGVAALTGAKAEDVIVTNGASYGVHLLANGIPLADGDEVLLMEGDFPSNILPWMALKKKGVRVRMLKPEGEVLRPEEIGEALCQRTRVVCLSWVHSFSGYVLDIDAIGSACRANQSWLIVNSTQGLGARPLDLSRTPVDALVNSGWKWLCGPYGTGFAWIRESLRARLDYNQSYWLSAQSADDLGKSSNRISFPDDLGARRYDVFGTASFFNLKPFGASVHYLLESGLSAVHTYVESLVTRLVEGIEASDFLLTSPRSGPQRSSLVFLTHPERERNGEIYRGLRESGIHIALRRGRLRITPHLYNTPGEVDRVLEGLARSA